MSTHSYATLLYKAWRYAKQASWEGLERTLNPSLEFDRVHIISFGDEHPYETLDQGTLTIHPVPPLRGMLRRVPFLRSWWVARSASRVIADHDIPLVAYLYGNILENGIPTVVAGEWAGIPSLVTVNNDYHQYFRTRPSYLRLFVLNNLLESWVYRRATHVKCVSEYLVGYVMAHGIEPDKISHISNKLDLSVFKRPGKAAEQEFRERHGLRDSNDRLVILSVAKLSPQKNLIRVLEALAQVRTQAGNWVFVLAGQGPLATELRRLIRSLELEAHARLLGWMPRDELTCAYSVADMFLFPSLFEGQGRVVFEALRYGLPVIGSNCGPIPEMVQDGYNGLLVDPCSVDSIATAVLRLVQDRETRERLSLNAVQGVKARYSCEVVDKQEIELYRQLIHGR